MSILAGILGLVLAAVTAIAWRLAPSQAVSFHVAAGDRNPALIGALLISPFLAIAFVIVAHELAHLVAYPGLLGPDSTFGLLPRQLLCYAHFRGELSRRRFIVVAAAPFLLLTFVPWLAAVVLGLHAPALEVLSIADALGCGGDVVLIALLLGVPSGSILRNDGWASWYRATE